MTPAELRAWRRRKQKLDGQRAAARIKELEAALREMVIQGPGVGTVPSLIQKKITKEAMEAFDNARRTLGEGQGDD